MRNNDEKIVSFVAGHDWYHQRFDGVPLFLSYIAKAELKSEKRKGVECVATSRICLFDNGRADWYILQDDIKKTSEYLLSSIDDVKDLRIFWRKDEKKFFDLCDQIFQTKLFDLSDLDLISLYASFEESYINAISSSSIIDPFSLGTDRLFSDLLMDNLRLNGRVDEFAEIFGLLSSAQPSFLLKMELDLLDVFEDYLNDQVFCDAMQRFDLVRIEAFIKDQYPQLYELLIKHRDKYFWIQNNYTFAINLDLRFFIGEMKKIFLDKNVYMRLKFASKEKSNLTIQKSNLLAELKADDQLSRLSFMSGDFANWQDDRKRMTFLATHYVTLFLKEFSRRFYKSIEWLKSLTASELDLFLRNGKLIALDLLERIDTKSVFVWAENEFEVFIDPDIVEVFLDLLNKRVSKDLDEFTGLSACPGKAVGRVRVLTSSHEAVDFEDDEILVAVMTRPDYLVAIKRAAAIVTDEGGVTSHAAVISRELDIPCVVGTGFATSLLKDGDWVQVDGNTGLVKKFES